MGLFICDNQSRQELFNWRRNFHKTAVQVVKKGLEVRFGKNQAQIAAFAREASDFKTGAAFWKFGAPDHIVSAVLFIDYQDISSKHIQEPSGALMSDYILKTFARHIAATDGSIFPTESDTDFPLPEGALSLAATAVCT